MLARGKRRKGSAGERELVKILNEAGIPARRVPLSGAMSSTGFGGDILVTKREPCLCPRGPNACSHWGGEINVEKKWECKRRRGFASIYKWLEDAAVLAFRGDRGEWIVTMRLSDYLKERK